jgi:hypothetical protein
MVGQRFQTVYGNSARVRNIQRIDLDIDSLPGRRSIQLERAQATQPTAHPGDTVMVEAKLRPFRGEPKNSAAGAAGRCLSIERTPPTVSPRIEGLK